MIPCTGAREDIQDWGKRVEWPKATREVGYGEGLSLIHISEPTRPY